MKYAPVLITTLCRYEHFKNCVESLSKCKHADKTELVIGLDYPANETHWEGYNQICNYVDTIGGFAKVTIFRRDKNYGPTKNSGSIRKYAYSKYDAVIVSEDDNVFAPCFLDYMNQALCKYEKDPTIQTIGAYLAPYYKNLPLGGTFLTIDSCAWGMGIWRDKDPLPKVNNDFFENGLNEKKSFIKFYKTYPAGAMMLLTMGIRKVWWGDCQRSYLNFANGSYQLRPTESLVKNCGFDGSGVTCSSKDEYDIAHLNLTTQDEYSLVGTPIPFSDARIYKPLKYKHAMPIKVKDRLKFHMSFWFNYFKYLGSQVKL